MITHDFGFHRTNVIVSNLNDVFFFLSHFNLISTVNGLLVNFLTSFEEQNIILQEVNLKGKVSSFGCNRTKCNTIKDEVYLTLLEC